jgi:malonyl-CoA decarboxylase
MQHSSFLGDILTTLFERRRSTDKSDDQRAISEMCDALLSSEGEISGLKLAAAILARYRQLDQDEKQEFFCYLNDALEFEPQTIVDLALEYQKDGSPAAFSALSKASEPRRQELLRRLNQPSGATAELVAMRKDLIDLLPGNEDLKRTDLDFVHLLRSWFNRGFLVLRQISWDTSATILEKIVAYEAVHAIDDWEDLRRRLYPPDRRCFAFFHPTMPDEPLIFVEVALTGEIPGAISDLLTDERTHLAAEDTTTAVFYSISNCQSGLHGVSFGNLLIKQVVSELKQQLPQLDNFVTLSPIPGFSRWLGTRGDNARAAAILAGDGSAAELEEMAAFYLLQAKRADGLPVDPVARFHLGNGAIVHDLHAGGDTTPKGLKQSGGVMVNYLYDQSLTERNHENFVTDKQVAASKAVKNMALSDKNSANGDPTK